MRAWVLMLATCFCQDAQVVEWKLQEGQEYSAAWTIDLRSVDSKSGELEIDFKVDFAGTLKVLSAGQDGATLELVLSKYIASGTSRGDAADIRYEDRALKKPDPGTPAGTKLRTEIEKPMALKLRRNGDLTFLDNHLVRQYSDSSNGWLGCRLPAHPVKVGDTWDGFLETHKTGRLSLPPMKCSYRLQEAAAGGVRIKLDDRRLLEASGRMYSLRAQSDVEFSVKEGHVLKSVIRLEGTDMTDRKVLPDTPEQVSMTKFEMAPKK